MAKLLRVEFSQSWIATDVCKRQVDPVADGVDRDAVCAGTGVALAQLDDGIAGRVKTASCPLSEAT